MVDSAPRSARQLARAQLTNEIKDSARRQLAEHGPAGVSLRAVARELGMVSSAVYRYFPSRDELLTALIIDAYDALGDAVDAAEGAVRRTDLPGRFRATARAVRAWALANPHEYGLVYGTPVPGYRAPESTIGPATRVPAVLVGILADGVAAGTMPIPAGRLGPAVRRDLAHLRALVSPTVPEPLLAVGLRAWTQLFGTVSFELFGHFHNVVADHDAWFELVVSALLAELQATGSAATAPVRQTAPMGIER